MTLFHPEAEREYLAAIDYYLAVGAVVAARFADAAELAISRVVREPSRFRESLLAFVFVGFRISLTPFSTARSGKLCSR
jgi:hypothetical protein